MSQCEHRAWTGPRLCTPKPTLQSLCHSMLMTGRRLSDLFSTSVTLSGVVAIIAGIVGEAVVHWTGTKSAPFMLAIGCLGTAFAGVWRFWVRVESVIVHPKLTMWKGENYGEAEDEKGAAYANLRATLLDKRILTLGLATTLFEGEGIISAIGLRVDSSC